MLNLAIDSLPLSDSIFSSRDYSGLQLFGLEHRPLHRAVACTWVQDQELRIGLKEFAWDDGQKILARHYLEGLKKLLDSQPCLAAYLRRHIGGIRASDFELRLELRGSEVVAQAVLDLPNWVPWRPGHCSGAFRLLGQRGAWRIQGDQGSGRVYLVNGPDENHRLFQAGVLDYTADTAIRFETLNDQVIRQETGLVGSLVYGAQLSPAQVEMLCSDLLDLNFAIEIEKALPSLRPLEKIEIDGPRGSIRLAFDDFYPNFEICLAIQNLLQKKGWSVHLVEDQYYQPSTDFDVKFMILRSLAQNPVFETLSLAGLPRSRLSMKSLSGLLQQVEAGAPFDSRWMSDLRLGFPLFKIPSYHFARHPQPHPLLRVFT